MFLNKDWMASLPEADPDRDGEGLDSPFVDGHPFPALLAASGKSRYHAPPLMQERY